MNNELPVKTSKTMNYRKLTGGKFSDSHVSVIVEKELAMFINGAHLATASIMPGMEKEFVTGYLFGQGFIKSMKEITSIEVEGNTAKVTSGNMLDLSKRSGKTTYRIVSGGGRTAYSEETELPEIESRMKVAREAVFRSMNALFETATMYRETEGVHAAGLFNVGGDPLYVVEDIGRHNTLDKTIGYGLMNNIDFSNVLLVSTGRMASEMVLKICRAGIPLVATKTAVTDKGLEIGRKSGLTIIGFVRDVGTEINTDMEVRVIQEAGMKVYSGVERVLCE